MNILRTFVVLILLSFWPSILQASRIENGYKALTQFDYFKSKKYFVKGLKYSPGPASQGLALIFYRKDNPFHSYDSSLHYVQQAIDLWDTTPARKKSRYAVYGFTIDSLLSLRNHISAAVFQEKRVKNTIADYNDFIRVHTWAEELASAVFSRDSIAFFDAVNQNKSTAYKAFLETYPESSFFELATDNFYHLQFNELTGDGTEESYAKFIENNAASPLRDEAEKRLFDLVTDSHSCEAYLHFIDHYPSNRFVPTAWTCYYRKFMSTYSRERLDEFIRMHPSSPVIDLAFQEFELFHTLFFPVIDGGRFGFMSEDGLTLIPAKFDYVTPFREGLSIVSVDGKQGVINKLNQQVVKPKYDAVSDFSKGYATIELDGKYGLIDRNGFELLACIYEDIGQFSEGLIYASINGKYGYYSERGELLLNHWYDEASDFKNGKAKVRVGDKMAFVNQNGQYELHPIYESVEVLTDSLYIFAEKDRFGLLNANGLVVQEARFDEIGSMSQGLAIAAIDNELVYLNEKGQIHIQNAYERFPNDLDKGEFRDSIAVAVKGGKYGRIDLRNKVLTRFKFSNIGIGKDAFPAQMDALWGLYNNEGKVILKPAYHSLSYLTSNLLLASKGDSLGVIKKDGSSVLPMRFQELKMIENEYFIVKSNGKWGLYRLNEVLLPAEYDQIGIFEGNYVYLNKEGALNFYHLAEKRMVLIKQEDE